MVRGLVSAAVAGLTGRAGVAAAGPRCPQNTGCRAACRNTDKRCACIRNTDKKRVCVQPCCSDRGCRTDAHCRQGEVCLRTSCCDRRVCVTRCSAPRPDYCVVTPAAPGARWG